MRIELWKRGAPVDERVTDPLEERVAVLLEEMPQHTGRLLFSGARWTPVEIVAIATTGRDVGLATLGPWEEPGERQPTIIGVWVSPAVRRRGIGTALVVALATASLRRYKTPARVQTVTEDGRSAVAAAVAKGAELVVVNTPISDLWLA